MRQKSAIVKAKFDKIVFLSKPSQAAPWQHLLRTGPTLLLRHFDILDPLPRFGGSLATFYINGSLATLLCSTLLLRTRLNSSLHSSQLSSTLFSLSSTSSSTLLCSSLLSALCPSFLYSSQHSSQHSSQLFLSQRSCILFYSALLYSFLLYSLPFFSLNFSTVPSSFLLFSTLLSSPPLCTSLNSSQLFSTLPYTFSTNPHVIPRTSGSLDETSFDDWYTAWFSNLTSCLLSA